MYFITGFSRDQLIMMDFESCLDIDSWAGIVDMFVNILPMKKLGFDDVLNSEGRPPCRSADLLKLYLYGYRNKLRSSRQLEYACKVNLEVIWLLWLVTIFFALLEKISGPKTDFIMSRIKQLH